MRSTVYLNPNFIPNNQASFYRNDLYEYIEKQEETSELILKKLNRQNAFIFNQYNELLSLLSTSNQQYLTLKNEQNDLLKSIHSISNVTKSNKQNVQKLLGFSKNNCYSLQQVKDKLDSDVNKLVSSTKELEDKLENYVSSELKTLENNVLNEMSIRFSSTQEQIINNILTELEGVAKKFESYLIELAKQPICELFEALNPGTKINKLIISGASINTATFINFDPATQQVKVRMNDGNLLVANCKDIEAVEINTKKSKENPEEKQ